MNRKYPIPNERKHIVKMTATIILEDILNFHYETHYPPSDNSLMDVQTVALCPKYYGYYSKISF